jgi:hypothetical protein
MLTRLASCILAATTCVLVSDAHARLQPIRNYDIPIATGSGKAISAEAVREAIIAAGHRGRRQWTFSNGGEDKLIAILAVRAHRIEVEVEYSPERVWIRYKSSERLKEQNGNIHPSYNKWVGELVNAMRGRLTRF